ncbi:nuclear transport factor 2 family protein [Janibacter hoylei]|uniref:nuclear transport factor 2 family protein n=1 Tax=Janibacter hoylei TaxID=364298 RepID=UPI0021A7D2B4|nr:nuclear transport factor 2 family protein [Janibacter hoylei]MCT1618946.1 nuclear transport factor 2 family protein [Janibacter hoylei]MCT2291769.1 nuclear transport factor 2 family protein [Janibacter hoylei]
MSTTAQKFRAAVESRDLAALDALTTEDLKFYSPAAFEPFEGREAVRFILAILADAFEDFRYVGDFTGTITDPGSDAADILVFRTRIGDTEIHGIDLLQTNAEGLIDTFTVMIRPLSAAQAVIDTVTAGLSAAPDHA